MKVFSSQILQLKSLMANIIAFSITGDVGSIHHFGELCLCRVVTMEMWYPDSAFYLLFFVCLFLCLFTSSPHNQLFFSSECNIPSYFQKCFVSMAEHNLFNMERLWFLQHALALSLALFFSFSFFFVINWKQDGFCITALWHRYKRNWDAEEHWEVELVGVYMQRKGTMVSEWSNMVTVHRPTDACFCLLHSTAHHTRQHLNCGRSICSPTSNRSRKIWNTCNWVSSDNIMRSSKLLWKDVDIYTCIH